MDKKFIFIFFVVLFLTLFLRLYKLSDIPPGVNRDEASIAYTAYSLLQTGKDEYGRFLPLSFQSFGDWKLPFYMYVSMPFIKVFGLSELGVRLPSALFGIATVAVTFFLVKQLFHNNFLSFLTMFLIALSPWHLHLSRVESESNTAVFLTTLAVLLFLKSLSSKAWLIIPSAIMLALTYFTYAGNYIFTTLLICGIIIIYRKAIIKTRYFLIASLVFIFLSGFIGFYTLGGNTTKVSGIGIFGDPAIVHAKIEIPRNQHENPQSLFAKTFHNRFIFASEAIFQNYLKSFSPEFLFIKGGDNKAHNIANFGNMYILEAPFLFLGILYLIMAKKNKESWLVLWWFLIAPMAASITKDAPHTNRMFAIFPILPLISAIGYVKAREWVMVRFKSIKNIAAGIVSLLLLFNVLIYFDRYFVHFPKNEGESWGAGYKNLTNLISQKRFLPKKIVISRPEYSPYIFLLFYQKYDPEKYQASAIRYLPTDDGFVHVKGFDRYEFREINWGEDIKISNRLLIDVPSQIPEFVKKEYQKIDVSLPNGKIMFTIIETK
ncbi:MAG: glycosyltransferase family 39 protein [Candidatus Levybacteria bacterium]|nr:glycosyltransferase family 39 protein [Candidatus Levybacteria bacterium]